MSELFLYTVAASHKPNWITCSVPYRINESDIFFGPCKKRLRELLRDKYLGPNRNSAKPNESIYLVGINGANSQKIRKIVWTGRIKEVMTFEHAYKKLIGKKFIKLRTDPSSPLLVKPVHENGKLAGYEHRSKLHTHKDKWVYDIVSHRSFKNIKKNGPKIIAKNKESLFETFQRDCCITLENIFFALGSGIEFDNKALRIIRRAQPKRKIDKYAIFGYRRDGSADGRTGSYLNLTDSNSEAFINWIHEKVSKMNMKGGQKNAPARTVCKSV